MAVERVRLKTERLILQPIAPSHSKAIFAAVVASRQELLPWMPWAKEPTLAGTREAAAGSVATGEPELASDLPSSNARRTWCWVWSAWIARVTTQRTSL